MATSSTSHKQKHPWLLRLVDSAENERIDFPLLEGYCPRALDLAYEGTVHESHAYRVLLATDAVLDDAEALWSVNGEEPVRVCFRAIKNHVEKIGTSTGFLYQVLPDLQGDWFPFAMTYGFASITIQVLADDENMSALSTQDIACICDKDDQETSVLGMVDTLISGNDAEVIRWMLAPQRLQADRMALVESGPVADSAESLSSFLGLCESAVRVFEANLNFLCMHAHCRTTKNIVSVSPSQVRRLGREELLWLARNPDVLRETSVKTPIEIKSAHYVPTHMETKRPCKTFDTLENRMVLAFAEEVGLALTRVLDEAQGSVARLRKMANHLHELDEGKGLMPALAVIQASLQREQPLLDAAVSLRRRMRGAFSALKRALPGVSKVRFRLPRRTKPFQEIPAYAALHTAMRAWENSGEFRMQRDGLVLYTWKMDKLYEYYVLYELLSALRARGFVPDGAYGQPFEQAEYSLESRYFQNEVQVATVYRLSRGNERITLYYQPVIYGDEREEHGIALHRTTLTSAGFASYWTPDYLLLHETPNGIKTLVLDAKFRKASAVTYDGSENNAKSCMLECLRKYKLETRGANGRGVDALWLLCGRAQKRFSEPLQRSAWAQQQAFVPDGIATVAPGANALPDFLDSVGVR